MKIDTGTITEDLLLAEGQLRSMRAELARKEDLIVTARLIIGQLLQENAQLQHRLNPTPDIEEI